MHILVNAYHFWGEPELFCVAHRNVILLCSAAVHNPVELELTSYTRKLDVSSSPFDSHGIAERHQCVSGCQRSKQAVKLVPRVAHVSQSRILIWQH